MFHFGLLHWIGCLLSSLEIVYLRPQFECVFQLNRSCENVFRLKQTSFINIGFHIVLVCKKHKHLPLERYSNSFERCKLNTVLPTFRRFYRLNKCSTVLFSDNSVSSNRSYSVHCSQNPQPIQPCIVGEASFLCLHTGILITVRFADCFYQI